MTNRTDAELLRALAAPTEAPGAPIGDWTSRLATGRPGWQLLGAAHHQTTAEPRPT